MAGRKRKKAKQPSLKCFFCSSRRGRQRRKVPFIMCDPCYKSAEIETY